MSYTPGRVCGARKCHMIQNYLYEFIYIYALRNDRCLILMWFSLKLYICEYFIHPFSLFTSPRLRRFDEPKACPLHTSGWLRGVLVRKRLRGGRVVRVVECAVISGNKSIRRKLPVLPTVPLCIVFSVHHTLFKLSLQNFWGRTIQEEER